MTGAAMVTHLKPVAALFVISFWLIACSGGRTGAPEAPSLKPRACGIASYYHPSLAGNLTANGETYDPAALTAAHRTLPFGAKLRLKRRDNGRAVTVRVNDRGPFVDGRALDLSRAAAAKLGLTKGDGLAEVCWSIRF